MGTVSRVYCAVVIAALIFGVQARWRHRVDCRECHQRCQEFEFRCPHACFVCFPRYAHHHDAVSARFDPPT